MAQPFSMEKRLVACRYPVEKKLPAVVGRWSSPITQYCIKSQPLLERGLQQRDPRLYLNQGQILRHDRSYTHIQGVSRMSVMVEFSVVPVGKGVSLSPMIARVLQIVVKSGIRYKANPMGTVLEGSWEEVMGVIKKCHDEVMKDAERAVTSIKIDDRKGKDARIEKKLESVEQKLGMKLNT
jgi:uncharacterized protein (TIGR00106 family)